MGIDARILVRNVPATLVTDEWLRDTSWLLARSIGAKHFFIADGVEAEEASRQTAMWNSAFQAHSRYADWNAEQDSTARRMIRQEIVDSIGGEPPTERRYALERSGTHYREEGEAAPGSCYYQDGDTVEAREGECMLVVNLWGRYYGEGYERGDILTYCAVGEWLEGFIPDCEIWYGGDSSGVEAELFDDARRRALRAHLYSLSGRDYFTRFGKEASGPPPCTLCIGGCYSGSQHGFGQSFAAFNCGGCGKSVQSRDGGKTWQKAEA